jgi:hypothetical protein
MVHTHECQKNLNHALPFAGPSLESRSDVFGYAGLKKWGDVYWIFGRVRPSSKKSQSPKPPCVFITAVPIIES